MLKDSGKTLDGKKIEYEIVENGYYIYLDGKKWIKQLDQFSKLFITDGSYEDNCLAQIDEITAPKPEPELTPSDVEKLRSDIDYLAAMTGFGLPSQSEVADEEV